MLKSILTGMGRDQDDSVASTSKGKPIVSIHADEDMMEVSNDESQDSDFDQVIGELEELLMDEEFLDAQNGLFEKYHTHFSDDEENKLIYMDAFQEYRLIEKTLKTRLPWFDMLTFMQSLRNDELEGDVFDVLASLGDFQLFKEAILAYKQQKEGTSIDLSGLLFVQPSK